MTLLQAIDLGVKINTMDGSLEIIDQVSFSVDRGDKLGIVGESGCGKSITALALMSLLPPNSQISGQILLDGENILGLTRKQLCEIRGNRIGIIFQEPMTALNPVKTIGSQISESLVLHANLNKKQIIERVVELMECVELPVKRFPLNLYPHQLSGGQRQRVMIATAIACKPDLLIADEPTTALDVTVQEQILDLIKDLVNQYDMALMMISHDLGVIAQTTEKVMVMYAGQVMEQGNTEDVFKQMAHPYTHGLFSAIPKTGSSLITGRKRLQSIPGQVPDPRNKIFGCKFADRCSFSSDECRKSRPEQTMINQKHSVWCYHPIKTGKD
ncbi:ABC transporter ATP-binding protein [bacterium]|nr:ABC transporter ATP-binding protein [bacterium]